MVLPSFSGLISMFVLIFWGMGMEVQELAGG
jgi:hypothetical protein